MASQILYPLDTYARENEEEVQRCLHAVDNLIVQFKNTRPVAGLVVEPIQGEGGDRRAPPSFFRGLRAITRKVCIYLYMYVLGRGKRLGEEAENAQSTIMV